MKNYTMLYKRVQKSKFTTARTTDASIYTATFQSPNASTAQKQLVKRELNTGLGRKIRIIRTITE